MKSSSNYKRDEAVSLGLVAKDERVIQSGIQYNRYFPPARNDVRFLEKVNNVNRIVELLNQVVSATLDQTKAIAQVLKGNTVYETCKNIDWFVRNHIQYAIETDEQLREPARVWADRFTGVDCDCYTIFISSILINLGIYHEYRLTEYKNKGYFQHIYPVVKTKNGEIIIDCVYHTFNAQLKFSNHMDLPVYQLGQLPMNNTIPYTLQSRFTQRQGTRGIGETTPPGQTTTPPTDPAKAKEEPWYKKYWWVIALFGAVAAFFGIRAMNSSGKKTKPVSGTGDKPKKKTSYKELREKDKVKHEKELNEKDTEIESLKAKLRNANKNTKALSGGATDTKKK